jgi:transcription elongation GreA/GreB family factor
MRTLKQQLYDRCVHDVTTRISSIQDAMKAAQSDAGEETKSSAGDKYETGRAMMHLEIEKLSMQLNDAVKARQILEQLDPDKETHQVQLGSIVLTTNGNFFMAISAGPFKAEGKDFFCISPGSPIGGVLLGKKAGEGFSFRNKEGIVKKVL